MRVESGIVRSPMVEDPEGSPAREYARTTPGLRFPDSDREVDGPGPASLFRPCVPISHFIWLLI